MDAYNMPVNDLVDTLKVIVQDLGITKMDLTQPKAIKVEAVFYKMLIEFGALEQFNLSPLESHVHQGSHSDTHSTLNLLAALRTFFRDINFPEEIGILDLYNPEPKRFRRFLSAMINVWNFGNSQHEGVSQCLEDVKAMARDTQKAESDVRGSQARVEKLKKSKADDEKKRIYYEDLIREKSQLIAELGELVKTDDAEKGEIKAQLEELQSQLTSRAKETTDEEARAKRLREVLHSEDVLQELKQTDSKLKEELNNKHRNERDYKDKCTAMEEKIRELESLNKQIEPMKVKHNRHQTKRSELKQMQWEKPTATEAVNELSLNAETTRKKTAKLRQQGAMMEGKFGKIIAQKKNELQMLESEHVTMVKGQSDEEKQSADLNRNIQDLQNRTGDVERQELHVKDLLENEEAKLLEKTNEHLKKIFNEIQNIS